MLIRITSKLNSKPKSPPKFFRRFGRDARGSTAAEFAIVALPFLMFCFGIMGYGLYFFTTTGLEFGVESAARQIRTGQAQNGGLTKAQFKQLICNAAGSFIDCSDSKIRVHIQSAPNWAGVVPTPCLGAAGTLSAAAGQGTDAVSASAGGASQAVLVTVCYEWTVAQALPYLMLGNMGNGSSVIQAAATFRTEPYQ